MKEGRKRGEMKGQREIHGNRRLKSNQRTQRNTGAQSCHGKYNTLADARARGHTHAPFRRRRTRRAPRAWPAWAPRPNPRATPMHPAPHTATGTASCARPARARRSRSRARVCGVKAARGEARRGRNGSDGQREGIIGMNNKGDSDQYGIANVGARSTLIERV